MKVLSGSREDSARAAIPGITSNDFITVLREGEAELLLLSAPCEDSSPFQELTAWVASLARVPLVVAEAQPTLEAEPLIRNRTPRQTIQNWKAVLDRQRVPVERLHFLDVALFPSVRWLRELAPLYREIIGLPFTCRVGMEVVTEESAALLAGMGCEAVCFRLDPRDGDPGEAAPAGGSEVDDVRRSFAIMRRHGIARWSHNLIGFPGVGREILLRSIHLNAEIDPDGARAFIFPTGPGDRQEGAGNADLLFLRHYFGCLVRLYRWGGKFGAGGHRRWKASLDRMLTGRWLPRRGLIRIRRALARSCHE